MMNRKIVSLLFIGLLIVPSAHGFEGKGSRQMDIERRTLDIERAKPEPSGEMMEQASKSMKPEMVASKIRKHAMTAYGFTGTASKEGSYFRIGVLLADLEALVRAGQMKTGSAVLDDLASALSGLGLSPSLIDRTKSINASVSKGERPSFETLSAISKDLHEEAAKMKMSDFISFGEWAEVSLLILSADKEADVSAGIEHIGKYNYAGYFLSMLKDAGLPKGVMDALGILKGFEGRKMGAKDSNKALKAFETIVQIIAG
ncbi:MAG: hypothetical protein HZA17_00385 [Nitrospirae bacterium]|nr:hypothetical protein [Nitrospirota bacterium]